MSSPSTALSALPVQMSSHPRQHFPLFQVQFRVTFDSVFRRTSSNVELKLACYFTEFNFVFSLTSCYLVAAFQLCEIEIFWKINLDQTVQIHNNNLDHKGFTNNVGKERQNNVAHCFRPFRL